MIVVDYDAAVAMYILPLFLQLMSCFLHLVAVAASAPADAAPSV